MQQVDDAVTLSPATILASSTTMIVKRTGRRKLPYVMFYLLPLASLVYLALLPHHPLIAQHIYTDENAWAADGARDAITSAHAQHAQHVQALIMRSTNTEQQASPSSPAAAAAASVRHTISHTWRQMGMDVHSYRHQHDASGRWAGDTSELTYAIVPSRMGDGKEAVALVVEYDPHDVRASAADSTMSAVAVGSGLAQYLLSQSTIDALRMRYCGAQPLPADTDVFFVGSSV